VPVRPLRGSNRRSTRAWLQQGERGSSAVLRQATFVGHRSSVIGHRSSVVGRRSSVDGRRSSAIVEHRRRSRVPRTARSHTRQRDELASSVIVVHSSRATPSHVCRFVRFAARTGAPRRHGFSKTNEARRSSFVGCRLSAVGCRSSFVGRPSSVVVENRRRARVPRTARSHTRQRDELASSVIVVHSSRATPSHVCRFVRFAARTGAPRGHGFSKTNEARQAYFAGCRLSAVGRRSSVVGRRSSVVGRRSSVVGRRSSVVGRRSSVVVGRRSSVVVEHRRRSRVPRTARSHTRQRDELASSVIVAHAPRATPSHVCRFVRFAARTGAPRGHGFSKTVGARRPASSVRREPPFDAPSRSDVSGSKCSRGPTCA
jgi:hypothetical protein